MSGFNDVPFRLLADGWEELIGIIVIFGLYVAGALTKMFSKRKGSEEGESKEPSYVVELAKKRARQRQEQARMKQARRDSAQAYGQVSEWDRLQEMKRQRMARSRGQTTQPPKPVQTQAPAYEPPKPAAPKPVRQPQTVQEYLQEAWTVITGPQPQPISRQVPQSKPMPQPVKPAAKRAKSSKRLMPATTTKAVASSRPLDMYLKNPYELRSAIVLKEILDKPVALREEW
jgi:hypothetical protein